MLSFKEFVSLQEGKLSRSIAIAGAVGLSVGLVGGAKVGDHHNRVKHIEKVTKAAIENPFHDQIDSEIPKDKMGSFLKSTDVPKDSDKARLKSDRQEGSKSKMRELHPDHITALKQGFRSYKAGRFSINSGPPAKGINPWHDGTRVKK